jgi:hypothetical protein
VPAQVGRDRGKAETRERQSMQRAMIDDGGKRHRQQLEEMGKPFRAELERQNRDLRGRSAAEIYAKLKREKKAAKARDRGSRQGPNQR